jgi:hypothetical protein
MLIARMLTLDTAETDAAWRISERVERCDRRP